MKLLADANVERALVNGLRERTHDVLWAVDLSPGTPDDVLLAQARAEDRVILTNDLDFGELVFRLGLANVGILLLRYRVGSSAELVALLESHWPEIEHRVRGHFVVATNSKLRIRPLDGRRTGSVVA